MASLHQPTEVFRFLHIRNPRIITATADPTVYLKYTLPASTTNLYTVLLDIKEAAEEDWKEQILAEVTNFKESSESYKNIFQVNAVFRDFFKITEFLRINDLPSGVTLKDWLINEYGITPATFFTPEVAQSIDKFWNNIFAQAIIPDNNGVLSQLILNLRIINLIDLTKNDHESTTTIQGIRAVLKALGLLPEELFPINFLPAESEEEEEEEEEETDIELYNFLTEGIKELKNWYFRNLRQIGSDAPAPLGSNVEPSSPEYIEWMEIVTDISNRIKALDKYESGYAAEIGTNFNSAMEILGNDDFINFSKIEIENAFLTKAKEIFSKLSASFKKGYNVLVVGKTVLLESAASCSKCCNPSPTDERFRIGPIGMGDFYKVEQQLHCYKPAEIAHVENVMIGETRNRETRRLDRFEEITVTEIENITETEKDFQSTSRSEQEINSQSVTEQNQNVSAGLNLSGSYGTVNFNSNFNVSSGGSSSSSTENAIKYSREIVERARQLEIKRLRTEKTTKILHEYEETNTHGFENTTEINQVGVYRWLDKFYYNRLINYGPHLLFEFIVPEPAFFHLYATQQNQNSIKNSTIIKPVAPDDPDFSWPAGITPLSSALLLNTINYSFWASFYGASLEAPPVSEKVISQAFNSASGGAVSTSSFNSLTVPDGYEGYFFWAQTVKWGQGDNVLVYIGGEDMRYVQNPPGIYANNIPNPNLPFHTGNIGVVALASDHWGVTLYVKCQLKQELLEKWQNDTFQKIWSAYNTKLQDYEDQLKALQQQLAFAPSFAETNPAFNRDIEKMELKKHSLEMMMEPRFKDLIDSVNCPVDECDHPEINKTQTHLKSKMIKFFETGFEWDQMTYEFYPYFWGRKCKWVKLYNLEDNEDALFQKFLQAGAARVVVPVRRGREASVMYYIETGVMQEDASIILTDPAHVAVNTELTPDPVPIIVETWITKMPTNLVVLHCVSGCIGEDGTTSGLPCYPTDTLDEEPPVHE